MTEKEIATYEVKDAVSDLRGGVKLLTPKQKEFLQALAESGDGPAAAKKAGYKSLTEALESEFVQAEAQKIQAAWSYEVRMNARFASGEHMRLMEKFEDEYQSLKPGDKAKMAAVLAKMSDTSLKASGKMNPHAGDGAAAVNVQINIGGNGSETKPETITITPENG